MLLQIDKSRTNELWRLIYGLGIRHVGERASQVLARAFGSMDALCAATTEQLQETSEIGPVLAESVRSWLDEPRNRQLHRPPAGGWRDHGGPARADASAAECPDRLPGKTYVITGTLDVDVARSGRGGARTPRRKGRQLGQQEDDGVSLSGREPGSKAEKARDARNSAAGRGRASWTSALS